GAPHAAFRGERIDQRGDKRLRIGIGWIIAREAERTRQLDEVSVATELEQRFESGLRDAIGRVRPAAVVDDERNVGRTQRVDGFVQLIALALNVQLPTPLANPGEKSRHRRMLQYVDAVGQKVEADTDH